MGLFNKKRKVTIRQGKRYAEGYKPKWYETHKTKKTLFGIHKGIRYIRGWDVYVDGKWKRGFDKKSQATAYAKKLREN